MSKITLKLNGGTHTVEIDPATPLLYILRYDLNLQDPHFASLPWPVGFRCSRDL